MRETRHRNPSFRRTTLAAGVFALALVSVVSFWWLWWPTGTDSEVDQNPPKAGVASHAERQAPAVPLPESTGVPQPLWLAVDETTVANPPPYSAEWSAEERVLVRIADLAATAASWRVGDRLTLPLPQLGTTYQPVIEEIDEGSGARSVLGRIVGDDRRGWRYVVTVAPTSLFAYIDTPAGSYELLAVGEWGWLLPSASMAAGLDFSRPDYFVPIRGEELGR